MAATNYALLQGTADGPGRTFLNSPADIRFRIANIDQMILANNGYLGIGTMAPNSQLHISGGKWDVANSEGDLKIGNDAMRLKIGIALGGGGAGDVRIRAHGGTNRLVLGSGTTDAMVVQDNNVTLLNFLLSPMFRVTQPLPDRSGPLPMTVAVPTFGGTLLVFACGSGWSSGASNIGMYVQVDGVVRASAATF